MNEVEKITNFQKIKAMDIDEMAEWLRDFQDNPDTLCTLLQCKKLFKHCGYDACLEYTKQWLESEVRE